MLRTVLALALAIGLLATAASALETPLIVSAGDRAVLARGQLDGRQLRRRIADRLEPHDQLGLTELGLDLRRRVAALDRQHRLVRISAGRERDQGEERERRDSHEPQGTPRER